MPLDIMYIRRTVAKPNRNLSGLSASFHGSLKVLNLLTEIFRFN